MNLSAPQHRPGYSDGICCHVADDRSVAALITPFWMYSPLPGNRLGAGRC